MEYEISWFISHVFRSPGIFCWSWKCPKDNFCWDTTDSSQKNLLCKYCIFHRTLPISSSFQFNYFEASFAVSHVIKHLWLKGSFWLFVPLFQSQICFVGSYSCEVIFYFLQSASYTHNDRLWDWKDYMPTSKQMWVWSRVDTAVVLLQCKTRFRVDSDVENNRRHSRLIDSSQLSAFQHSSQWAYKWKANTFSWDQPVVYLMIHVHFDHQMESKDILLNSFW